MAQRAVSPEGSCIASVPQKEKRNSNMCEEYKKAMQRDLCNLCTACSYNHVSSETQKSV